MRRLITCVYSLVLPLCVVGGDATPDRSPTKVSHSEYSSTPLYFIENKGQVVDQNGRSREDLQFRLAATTGLNIYVGHSGLNYQWVSKDAASGMLNTYRMDVVLEGANLQSPVVTEQAAPYHERYISGATESYTANSWSKVIYKDIYPNIDWVLYTQNGVLEYDFVVHPGGQINNIRLRYEGSNSLKLSANGKIIATTPMGTVTENAPISFTASGVPVASRFRISDNVLSFETGAYNGTLIIDPVLEWSTYYGAGSQDYGRAVATDNSGNVYVSGSTTSNGSNLATVGAHQGTFAGPSNVTYGDAYLAKFDAAGNRLWATYFGGTASEGAWDIICDEHNNVYMAGQAASTSAIAGGNNIFQNAFGGGSSDAFLAKFDPTGNLVWSTYYGGSGMDEGWGVASDKNGSIYLTGRTSSTSNIAFGTGVHQTVLGGSVDGFLVKFDTLGNRIWATYFGGTGQENTWDVTCDKNGNVYVSGETSSPNNIATANAHQTTKTNASEAFLIKFAPNGTRVWGTYYGGNGPSQNFGTGVATDDVNNVYITGYTVSTNDIATPGSHQPTKIGGYTAYLAKFDDNGTRLWGTYFGGTGEENGYDVATDPWGNVYITGYTSSPDNISTAGAINVSHEAGNDVYVAKFNRDGVRLWGTYFGGPGYDAGWKIAADQFGSIYITGFTNGGGMSTPNGFQTVLGGGFDGFLIRLSECTAVNNPELIAGPDSICANSSSYYSVAPIPGAQNYTWILPNGWIGNSTTDSILATANNVSGRIALVANGTCNSSDTIFKEIGIYPEPIIDVLVDGIKLSTIQDFQSYQWYMNNLMIAGAIDSIYNVIENGIYSVRVVDQYGCSHISRPFEVNNVSVNDIDGKERISVFPNPATSQVHIRSAKPVNVIITSIEGKVIASYQQTNQIDVANIASGLYFLRIQNDQQQELHIERLIIQR